MLLSFYELIPWSSNPLGSYRSWAQGYWTQGARGGWLGGYSMKAWICLTYSSSQGCLLSRDKSYSRIVTFFSHSCTQHSNHHQRGHLQIAKDSPIEEMRTDNKYRLYLSVMPTGAACRILTPSPVFLLHLPSHPHHSHHIGLDHIFSKIFPLVFLLFLFPLQPILLNWIKNFFP